jgi:hypothetical protein
VAKVGYYRNKPLQPPNGSSMSKRLSFDSSNEPAVATVKPALYEGGLLGLVGERASQQQ